MVPTTTVHLRRPQCVRWAVLALECAMDSGLSTPASIATSPAFTLEANKDYTINFSLFAGLNLEEGPFASRKRSQ